MISYVLLLIITYKIVGQQWDVPVRGAGYEPISTVLMEPNHPHKQNKWPIDRCFCLNPSA